MGFLGQNKSFPILRQLGGSSSGSAPVITGVPTITGTPEVGETLTAVPAAVSGNPVPTRTWQWYADAVAIGGATAITFLQTSSQTNADITVKQIETNEHGVDDATSDPVGPVVITPAGLPDIETWFDPASLVPLGDGALVDAWVDEMGGADATAALAFRPAVDLDGLNGEPGILFTSGNSLSVARTTAVPWTEFIVVLPNGSGRRLVTRNGAGNVPYLEALNDTNRTVSGSSGGTIASLSPVQFAKPFIMLRTVTATLQRFFYNQTMIGDSTTLDNFANTITNIAHATTFDYTGWVGDYGRFDAELSDANKGLLFQYLVSKYDILHNFIVCDGDSLTFGTGSADPTNDSYPAQLGVDLDATYGVQRFSILNYGDPSDTIADRAAAFAAQSGRWAVHVGNGILNIYVFWCGTNDLFIGNSATDTYNAYVAQCQAAQAAGFAVCACTIMNHATIGANAGSWTQVAADAVNTDIRANWATFADYFADIQAQPELLDITDLTYYNADEVHLVEAGYTVVKNTVEAALGL